MKVENVTHVVAGCVYFVGRICPKVRWRVVSIAIEPHDHAACG